jgi:hypothetical protein
MQFRRSPLLLAALASLLVLSCGDGGSPSVSGATASSSSSSSADEGSTSAESASTVMPDTTAVTDGPTSAVPGDETAAPPVPEQPAPNAVPCGTQAAGAVAVEHVIWIWMENHKAGDVLGNAAAPFETALASQCGSSMTFRQTGSPSLPNYIAATAGDTFGINDNGQPPNNEQTADNLFRQVRATGRASRSYIEAMGSPCQLRSSGLYAVKHNPAAYYVGGDDRAACQSDNIPLGNPNQGSLASDLANDTLPAFASITPDLCNDTHDCPVAQGDAWLSQWLPAILGSPPYRRGGTVVFIVWDEPTPMPFIAIGPSIPPGTTSAEPFDHYSLLRTTEEMLGLPLLGRAASVSSMRGAFGL